MCNNVDVLLVLCQCSCSEIYCYTSCEMWKKPRVVDGRGINFELYHFPFGGRKLRQRQFINVTSGWDYLPTTLRHLRRRDSENRKKSKVAESKNVCTRNIFSFFILRARGSFSFRMFKSLFQAFLKTPDLRSSAIKRVVCYGRSEKLLRWSKTFEEVFESLDRSS